MTELLVSALVVAVGATLAAFADSGGRGTSRVIRLLALAPALGFGLLSLCGFAALSLGAGLRAGGVLFLLVGLATAARLALRPSDVATGPVPAARWPLRAPDLLFLGAAVLWIGMVASIQARERPRGEWDAVAMWNARARLLERSESVAPEAIRRLERGQPAYPLYLPMANAAQAVWSGGDGSLTPRLTALWSLAGLLAALVLFTPVRFGPWPTVAVASTPVVVFWGLSQGADLLLAYHIFLGIAGILRVPAARGSTALSPWLVGFLIGLLPWIKEEGWLYASVGALLSLSRRSLRTEPAAEQEADWNRVWLGVFPGILAVCAFKLIWVGPGVSADFAARLRFEGWSDADAWLTVARGYVGHFADLGSSRWSFAWPAVAALWFLGAGRRRAALPLEGGAAGLLLAIALGWALFFPISPFGTEVHVRQALERLLLQPFPSLVLLALRRLESRLAPGSTAPAAATLGL